MAEMINRISLDDLIGRLFYFKRKLVKVRWLLGDEQPQHENDEPTLYGYGRDGKEEYLATLNLKENEIFDVLFVNAGYAEVHRYGTLDDLQPVEEAWASAL